MARTQEELDALIALPLDLKIELTKQRIREWVECYGVNGVCVSFSGGKDSTVLLDIARSMYGNDLAAVFSDTGLEYPELRRFVRQFENVDIIRPEQSFVEVISHYGYPVVSKECAETVSGARTGLERQDGTYDTGIARSKPMSFWTEQDVLQYIREKNLPIVSVYGDIIECKDKKNKCKLCTTGCDRTGCIYCGFGLHLEKGETRFQKLKNTHPKQWAYCLNGGV